MDNRKIHIEFIRVFAIGLTIMIHISNLYIMKYPHTARMDFLFSVIFNSLARVCVPLFFMVSGIFLIRAEYDKKKYWTRIGRFVLILAAWSIIYYLAQHGFDIADLGKDIVSMFFGTEKTSRHLWYMYAIIGIYIALPFIQNMCKNLSYEQENLFMILWGALSGLDSVYIPIARTITKTNVSVSYPVPIIYATYYLGYFVCGHILYNRFREKKGTTKNNALCIITYLVSTGISIAITYLFSIKNQTLFDAMTWYRGVLIVVASFSLFILVIMNEDKIQNKSILGLSRLSFGVYLIHYLFVILLEKYVNVRQYPSIIFVPIVTLVVYIASLASCWLIKKTPILNKLM